MRGVTDGRMDFDCAAISSRSITSEHHVQTIQGSAENTTQSRHGEVVLVRTRA